MIGYKQVKLIETKPEGGQEFDVRPVLISPFVRGREDEPNGLSFSPLVYGPHSLIEAQNWCDAPEKCECGIHWYPEELTPIYPSEFNIEILAAGSSLPAGIGTRSEWVETGNVLTKDPQGYLWRVNDTTLSTYSFGAFDYCPRYEYRILDGELLFTVPKPEEVRDLTAQVRKEHILRREREKLRAMPSKERAAYKREQVQERAKLKRWMKWAKG